MQRAAFSKKGSKLPFATPWTNGSFAQKAVFAKFGGRPRADFEQGHRMLRSQPA